MKEEAWNVTRSLSFLSLLGFYRDAAVCNHGGDSALDGAVSKHLQGTIQYTRRSRPGAGCGVLGRSADHCNAVWRITLLTDSQRYAESPYSTGEVRANVS